MSVLTLCLVLLLLSIAIFKRRKLYVLSYKVNGPFALPFIGNALQMAALDLQKTYKMLRYYALHYGDDEFMRVWIGPQIYIFINSPRDVEALINRALDKASVYSLVKIPLGDSLITAETRTWRKHRKILNPTFNPKIINSFFDVFARKSADLVRTLTESSGQKLSMFPVVFPVLADIACETLFGTDPAKVPNFAAFQEELTSTETLTIKRVTNPLYFLPCYWRLSGLKRQLMEAVERSDRTLKRIFSLKMGRLSGENVALECLMRQYLGGNLTQREVLEEMYGLLAASSETSAFTFSTILLVMGIYPHIQDRVLAELDDIFGDSDRPPTPEDVAQMSYLARVHKETMRIAPTVPLIARAVREDIQLPDLLLPQGANIVINILKLHRNPKFWRNPEDFDPERFLPEEVAKRPRCSYIPFSFGVRNCIGQRYAELSIIVLLASVLRKFRVQKLEFGSIDDVEFEYLIGLKPPSKCRIVLEERR